MTESEDFESLLRTTNEAALRWYEESTKQGDVKGIEASQHVQQKLQARIDMRSPQNEFKMDIANFGLDTVAIKDRSSLLDRHKAIRATLLHSLSQSVDQRKTTDVKKLATLFSKEDEDCLRLEKEIS